jgi:hypothetical protein
VLAEAFLAAAGSKGGGAKIERLRRCLLDADREIVKDLSAARVLTPGEIKALLRLDSLARSNASSEEIASALDELDSSHREFDDWISRSRLSYRERSALKEQLIELYRKGGSAEAIQEAKAGNEKS